LPPRNRSEFQRNSEPAKLLWPAGVATLARLVTNPSGSFKLEYLRAIGCGRSVVAVFLFRSLDVSALEAGGCSGDYRFL